MIEKMSKRIRDSRKDVNTIYNFTDCLQGKSHRILKLKVDGWKMILDFSFVYNRGMILFELFSCGTFWHLRRLRFILRQGLVRF